MNRSPARMRGSGPLPRAVPPAGIGSRDSRLRFVRHSSTPEAEAPPVASPSRPPLRLSDALTEPAALSGHAKGPPPSGLGVGESKRTQCTTSAHSRGKSRELPGSRGKYGGLAERPDQGIPPGKAIMADESACTPGSVLNPGRPLLLAGPGGTQFAFGNAPQFATAARPVDGDEHWSTCGPCSTRAPTSTPPTSGQTLLDLTIRLAPRTPSVRYTSRWAGEPSAANSRTHTWTHSSPGCRTATRTCCASCGTRSASSSPRAPRTTTRWTQCSLPSPRHGRQDGPRKRQHHVAHGLTHYEAGADQLAT